MLRLGHALDALHVVRAELEDKVGPVTEDEPLVLSLDAVGDLDDLLLLVGHHRATVGDLELLHCYYPSRRLAHGG